MLATTTDQLASRFRSDVDDKITDVGGSDYNCLWSNEDVYGYMTAACDRVAKDTGAMQKVMHLPVVAGEATTRCPDYVTEIRSARLVGLNKPIRQVNTNAPGHSVTRDYGLAFNDFRDLFDSSGVPDVFIRDYDAKALRFAPNPNIDDTLEIQCETLPTMAQQAGMPLPFTDTSEQLLVLYFMKAQAYRKQDAETEDLVRAREYDALYAHWVSERKYELQRYRRSPPVMRMNW